MRRLFAMFVVVLIVMAGGMTIGRSGSAAQPAVRLGAAAQSASDEPSTAHEHAASRGEVETLLGHHSTLAVRFMRATITGDPGFVDVADAAVVRNTNDLGAALRSLIGRARAERFAELWERRTNALFQYAQAVRDDDSETQQQARARLDRHVDDLAALLDNATAGRLSKADVTRTMRAENRQLIAQLDAFAAEDYQAAYRHQREAYATVFPFGRALVGAARRTGSAGRTPPTAELSATFSQLLGEHVELAVDAMRSGVSGGADFEAAAGALNANTREVAGAMDSLFGPKRAKRFNNLWADHIELFVDYTVAVAEDDDDEKQRVKVSFDKVIDRLKTTIGTMAGGTIDSRKVQEALVAHETQLFRQIEAYVAGEYEEAHDISYTAYQHMRQTAGTLATGFATAAARKLPSGGVDTGGGGTAATIHGAR